MTRKLCYRKDDRAMPPCDLYMDALKFSGLPDYAHRYYSQHFSWAFVPIEAMNVVQNLKSVALPVPEIIGGTLKFGYSLDTPTLPFLQNFSWAFIRIGPVNVPAKFEVRSFTRS